MKASETARARVEGPCTFRVGELEHGSTDGRWWRVELVGRGVEVVHLHRTLVVTVWNDGLRRGDIQRWVRRQVSDVEAEAFERLVAGYRPITFVDGARDHTPRPSSTSSTASTRKLESAMERGSTQLLAALERVGVPR